MNLNVKIAHFNILVALYCIGKQSIDKFKFTLHRVSAEFFFSCDGLDDVVVVVVDRVCVRRL